MKRLLTLLLAISFFFVTSCNIAKMEPQSLGQPVVEVDVSDVLARAKVALEVTWTPTEGNIPNVYGEYPKGVMEKGLPYSSARRYDKFIGYEVSIETFLSSLKNPYSKIYTEHLTDKLSASYYGMVCSTFISYVFNLPMWLFAAQVPQSCYFTFISSEFKDIEVCDVILKNRGHVFLVTDVIMDNGMIIEVELTESTGTNVRKSIHTEESFNKLLEDATWGIYRYEELTCKSTKPASWYLDELKMCQQISNYQYDILTDRGDKAAYREGEEVVLTSLSSSYDSVYLVKNYEVIDVYKYSLSKTYKGLLYGQYEAYLKKENGEKSRSTYFEVINTNVYLRRSKVVFSSKNAVPIGVRLITEKHSPVYTFSFNALMYDTQYSYSIPMSSNAHALKVVFKGRYGSVTNEPIKL